MALNTINLSNEIVTLSWIACKQMCAVKIYYKLILLQNF